MDNYIISEGKDSGPGEADATADLPVKSLQAAKSLLDALGNESGTLAGTGVTALSLGRSAAVLRQQYHEVAAGLIKHVEKMRAQGKTPREIAQSVSAERVKLMKSVRAVEGKIQTKVYEFRDLGRYGNKDRSFDAMMSYYMKGGEGRKPLTTAEAYDKIISGAQRSNSGVDTKAFDAAKYLSMGGKVITAISFPLMGYQLMTATPDELPRLIARDFAGIAGSAIATTGAVSACAVWTAVSAGWGVGLCGLAAGVIGGMSASALSDYLFCSMNMPKCNAGVIDTSTIKKSPR